MKIVKVFLCALLVFCLSVSVAMAVNTTVRKGGTINITPDGSTNWDSVVDANASQGLTLLSIVFVPSASTDILVVKDGSTGPVIFPALTDIIGMSYSGLSCRPYIKATDCTFSTPANVKILMFFK
jgi:hypothetical protein